MRGQDGGRESLIGRRKRPVPAMMSCVGMPSNKDEQEDAVIAALLSELAQAGLSPELIERPDRLPRDPRYLSLTTDGVVELDGQGGRETWSVDVMSLAADPMLFVIPNALYEELEPIALSENLVLTLEGTSPPAAERGAVIKAVKQALNGSQTPHGEFEQGDLVVRWAEPTGAMVPGLNLLLVPEVGSAVLSDQIVETIRVPLVKKATRQAKPAVDAGLKSAVILDRVGHAGISQGTHWLPQYAETFRGAVDEVLSIDHYLDAVLLHGVGPGWAVLHGKFPGLSP